MMDDFARAHGLKSARLRYFNAAGADPAAEIGEDHNPETHLIPLALDVALGIRPEIQMFGTDYPTPDGTALRDYVHVCDLARAHVLAVKYLLDDRKTIALNLGTGQGISVRQVIDTAQEVTGRRIRTKQSARRPGDPAELVADPRKANDVLGWSTERSSLKEIITDAWRWHALRFRRNDPMRRIP
jgi:UDP-glucose 4-epimerase